MGVSAVSLQPRQGLVRDFAGAFYGSSLLTPVRIHQQLSVCQPVGGNVFEFERILQRLIDEHIREYRNHLAHGDPVAKQDAQALRELILGTRSQPGILQDLESGKLRSCKVGFECQHRVAAMSSWLVETPIVRCNRHFAPILERD